MLRVMANATAAVVLLAVAAGCASTSGTPRYGYSGPPLSEWENGYYGRSRVETVLVDPGLS